MELVQVANCTRPKFVHVATCTSQPAHVATCTSCSLYRFFVRVATCTKSQLVHNIHMFVVSTYLCSTIIAMYQIKFLLHCFSNVCM